MNLERESQSYDRAWSHQDVLPPSSWAIWRYVQPVAEPGATMEIGPGKFPRVPIRGSLFVDVSDVALQALQRMGGYCLRASGDTLPLPSQSLQLACAFEIIEHVQDDRAVLGELYRVLRPNGTLMLSVPVHARLWSEHDEQAHHKRRYDPAALLDLLAAFGFRLERYNITVAIPNKSLWRVWAWALNHLAWLVIPIRGGIVYPIYTWLERTFEITPWHADGAQNFIRRAARAFNVILICRKA